MFYEVKFYVPVNGSDDNLVMGGLYKDRQMAFKQADAMLKIHKQVNVVYVDAYNDDELVDDASFEVFRVVIIR